MTRHFFTDTASTTLAYAGEGDIVTDDFDPAETDTVTLDTPWNDFFGTDEYVQFEATVAQPIVQPYFYDGELQHFRKDEAELRQAQAQLENLPWTMGHPPQDRVTTADEIRGFWTDPRYDDGQHATLHIPATDAEAVRFAVHNDEVSIGFSGTLDWVDDDGRVDAIQRDMAYDHVASVENGRCPPEKGCGLHADDEVHDMSDSSDGANPTRCGLHTNDDAHDGAHSPHGHVHIDGGHGVRTMATEESGMTSEMDPKFSEGDWVEWDWSGGTARGRVTNVSTERALTTSGTTRDPIEEGEPVYKVKHYDDGEWGNMKVAYESNLRSVSQPEDFSDNAVSSGCTALCSPGPCSCGLHDPFTDVEVDGEDVDLVPPEAAQNAAQDALDARANDDVTVNGMTAHGWARAEQLAAGEELSPSDIVGSSGAMAPWWSRHAQYSIETEDGELALQGSEMDNPWSDNSYTAGKGWGGVAGYKWAIRKGNEIKRARGEEPVYSTDATITIPDFTSGDLVRHRYIDDIRGYVAHNPSDRPYVMVDPIVDGERNSHTMTFGTADIELMSKADGGSTMRDSAHGTAPDGIYVEDGDWYGIAPDETADDEPKYDLNTCNDVKDAYNLRNNGDYDVETSTLVARIERAAQAHDCPSQFKPWVDSTRTETDSTISSNTMTDNLEDFIDEHDLSFGDVVDALDVDLQALDGVPNEPHDFYDGEPSIEDLADDFDAVDLLVDEKEDLEERVEDLSDKLHGYKREQFEEKADELTDLTDKWSREAMLESFDDGDLTVDDIEDRIELVEDIKASETTTVTDTGDEGDVDDPDFDTTDHGRFDLRENTRV